jgi:hypothetical protein
MGGQYEPLLQDAVTPADHCSPSFVQTLRSLLSVLFCSIKCCMFNFGGKELLTPLDCAAAKHCPELMALLLEAGGMPGDNVLYAAIHEVSLQTEGKGQCAAHAARITHVFMSRAFKAAPNSNGESGCTTSRRSLSVAGGSHTRSGERLLSGCLPAKM